MTPARSSDTASGTSDPSVPVTGSVAGTTEIDCLTPVPLSGAYKTSEWDPADSPVGTEPVMVTEPIESAIPVPISCGVEFTHR
jgi:hypothetical protein